jgi:RNA polymerase sigma-70 factor, ECF subfamily
MIIERPLHQAMLDAIPHLRAFAISLTGNVTYADDLVQAALLRGLENLDKFQPGTSMQAWLFTILRNHFYTELRQRRREVADPDGTFAGMLAVLPEQDVHLDVDDMLAALARLSVEQPEALLLVGAEGVSYEEAARICGTTLGNDQEPREPGPHTAGRVAGPYCRGGSRARPPRQGQHVPARFPVRLSRFCELGWGSWDVGELPWNCWFRTDLP